MNTHIY